MLSNSTLDMLNNKMLQTALPILYIIIFIVSIIFNSISMWFLCFYVHPKSPTIIFAINLVATDLLYSLTLPFQVVYHLSGNNWPFGTALCGIVTVLFYGNMHCSIWTIMSISIERYLKIVHPLHSKSFTTNKTALLVCISIWVCVLLIEMPYMYTKLTFQVEKLQIVTCFDVLPRNMFASRMHFYIYFASSSALTFFLPLIVMAVCYGSIISTLLRSPTTELKEKKRQTLYLIVAVLTVFLVCYLPNNVLQIVHMLYQHKHQTLYVEYKLSLGFSSLNCCLDPFVYYFGSKEFRSNIEKKLFCCITKALTDTTGNMSGQAIPLTQQPN